MAKDLKAFGEKLETLRKAAGLSLEALLEKLNEIHQRGELEQELTIDSQLLWKWAHAYTYKGRQWTPSRPGVLYLIEVFAGQLTLAEAQAWALQAGYTLGETDLQAIFPPDLDWPPAQIPQLPHTFIRRRQLETTILASLKDDQAQAVVLWGAGGTGKTTLVTWMAKLLAPDFPDGIIWISVQPEDTVMDLLDEIAKNLGIALDGDSTAKRARRLHSRLRKKRCLLILDDLWTMPDLAHLRLGSETSRLICMTRDAKVALLLEALLLPITGLTAEEGLALLTRWAGYQIEASELVVRLGGLPLALALVGAQLQAGLTLAALLAAFQERQIDLSILDMDDPQSRTESLTRCFDISYDHLDSQIRQRFAQLGYFVGHNLAEAAMMTVWGITPREARETLKQLLRFAFLAQAGPALYWLHPLLHDYARQKLSSALLNRQLIQRRHALWHIRYALYHPGILEDNPEAAPDLEQTWPDVVAGVTWAARHDPQLATQAALLAHTERPALLEEVGLPLVAAVNAYLSRTGDQVERAVLHELLGDLFLLQVNPEVGAVHFEQARALWQRLENGLASSRAKLRLAGAYLLRQDQISAAKAARQAQALLKKCLPISDEHLNEVRTLFYWLTMIYNPLIRWADLPETDVAMLAELAGQTGQPVLQARGLHIYTLWCVTDTVPRLQQVRQRGRDLALQAYCLWRSCGWQEQADSEISFSKYYLTHCFSRRTACRFARRRSAQTPQVSPSQVRLITKVSLRWWLQASAEQRINWLSWMLPRYLGAENRPRQPVTKRFLSKLEAGSRAYEWVEDILDIGMLGQQGRRVMLGGQRPPHHLLNGPEWRVLSGQRVLPLSEDKAGQLARRYLQALEAQL